MIEEFLIKDVNSYNIKKELQYIGFDECYLSHAQDKYKSFLFKIYDLTPIQSTILKQTALSCGTDCAVNRDVLTQSVEFSDVILFATKSQLQEIIKKLYIQPFNLKTLAKQLELKLSQKIEKIKINKSVFNWNKTYIMGILNITDNSFSDGKEFLEQSAAIKRFKEIVKEGADIIDIGAESTAPDNKPTSTAEEMTRIKRVLTECKLINPSIPISIDTRNSETAKLAIELGANIINDVSGLFYDEQMADVVANSNVHVVLTFDDEIVGDTIDATIKGLIKRVKICENKGIKNDRIIVDSGLGFNKTYEQNFELIKRANEICSLGFPVMYGPSRKSFIQKITGLPPKDTENANVILAGYLANKGVNIVRVHDVLAHKSALKALDKVLYD